MGPPAPDPALRGRAHELAAVREELEAVGGGRPSAVLIEGEPGIGKTRFLAEIVSEARGRGFRSFFGKADELERLRPFGALAEAVGSGGTPPERRADFERLIKGGTDRTLSAGSDPGALFRMVDAFVEVVAAESLARPVVVAIDDLQWADPSTLVALRALSRRATGLPILFIATYRPLPAVEPLTSLLDALVREGARSIVLPPLDEEAVLALVAEVVGVPPAPSLAKDVAGAAGNPLFVIELVRALEDEGMIYRTDRGAEVSDLRVPTTLRLTIVRRIAFLPQRTLDALRAAAILGSSFSVTDLATTTGRSALEVVLALRDAQLAGILETTGEGRLRFRHDLIRDAMYQDLPPPMRAALHQEAARRLADAGASALQVAEHLDRAGGPGDAEAVQWIVQAARDVAARSPAAAAELLGRALDGEASWPGRDGVAVERASNLFWSGRVLEAESLLRGLLERGLDPSVEGPARALLVQILMAEGRPHEAAAEAQAADTSTSLSDLERARIAAWGAHGHMLVGDLDGARETAEASRAIAEAAGDALTACVALCCSAVVRELEGLFTEALDLAEQAVKIADRSAGRSGHRFHVHMFEGMALTDLDRLDDAVAALQRGRATSEDIGARWNLALYQNGLIAALYLIGRWDDALVEYDAYLDLAEESGTHHGMISNNAVRALIGLHRDDLRTARQAIEAAEREFAESGPQFRVDWMMWAHALLLEAAGDAERAYAILANAWDLCVATGLVLELPLHGPDLARLAVASGDVERAKDTAARIEQMAAREPSGWLVGAALRARGVVSGDVEVLVSAVDAYRSSPRPLERALACEDAAAALARTERSADAAALWGEASDIYDSLGAARDVKRVETALRKVGVRRRRSGRPRRPPMGWESLTDAERRVVELVGEGLTNRQIGARLFLSHYTVQWHLRHVFQKLGVSTRAELAGRAARRPRRSAD